MEPRDRSCGRTAGAIFAPGQTAGLILVAWISVAMAAGAAGAGDAERGRAIAEAACARCHALGTTGDSPHADAPAFRTLSERYPVAHLQEALGEGMVVGHPDMPEVTLAPAQIDDFIAYLQSIQVE